MDNEAYYDYTERDKDVWDGIATWPQGANSPKEAWAMLAENGEVPEVPKGSKVDAGDYRVSVSGYSNRFEANYDAPDGGGGTMEVIARWMCEGDLAWRVCEHSVRVNLPVAVELPERELVPVHYRMGGRG